jgi:hypothetical protein
MELPHGWIVTEVLSVPHLSFVAFCSQQLLFRLNFLRVSKEKMPPNILEGGTAVC